MIVKNLFLTLCLIPCLIIANSCATPVSISRTNLQAKYGTLTRLYYETISGPASPTPTTNTAFTPSSNSGSYSVAKGSSAYLWSPQFGSTTAIRAGKWVLDIWISARSSKTISISIFITNSAGTHLSTVINSFQTPAIGTSKAQVVLKMSGNVVSVPINGYINVVIYTPSTECTIYWGVGQPTNFQAP